MRKYPASTLTVVYSTKYTYVQSLIRITVGVALHCNLPTIYFRIIPRVNQQTAAAVDIHIYHTDYMCICFDIGQANEITKELLKHERF